MIPKFRMWNRITSQLHLVGGLYFDDKEAEYVDDDNVLRFIGFKNIELMQSTGLKRQEWERGLCRRYYQMHKRMPSRSLYRERIRWYIHRRNACSLSKRIE